MIFNFPVIGKTWGQLSQWHSYFTWYPVVSHDKLIWLERVDRKLIIGSDTKPTRFVYRIKD